MIFDINAFIGKWPFGPVRAHSPEMVAAELRGWGIDRAAVCSTRSIFVHAEDGNCEVERAIRAHAKEFAGFACLSGPPDPATGGLENYARRGFTGVRLYPRQHGYHPLYAGFVDVLLEAALAHGLPVMLAHRIILSPDLPVLDLNAIEQLVERHSRNKWILAGLNDRPELQLAARLIKRHAGVVLETSCLTGFEAVAKLVEECGAERILFGSGAPMQHARAGVEKIMQAKIPESAREAILGGNALRLLVPTYRNSRTEPLA